MLARLLYGKRLPIYYMNKGTVVRDKKAKYRTFGHVIGLRRVSVIETYVKVRLETGETVLRKPSELALRG